MQGSHDTLNSENMLQKSVSQRVLGFFIAGLFITLITLLSIFFPYQGFIWDFEPAHSAIEAIGAISAIFMSFFLLYSQTMPSQSKNSLLALGFLGMGILDIFHALCSPGQAFVLLHDIALIFGGLGFSLTWLSTERVQQETLRHWGTLCVSGACMIIGVLVIVWENQLPIMMTDRAFTQPAIILNIIALFFFIIGTAQYVSSYIRDGGAQDRMFAIVGLLYISITITFGSTHVWGARWWLWHFIRLLAYLIVLVIIFQAFNKIMADLRRHHQSLQELVSEQTAALTKQIREIQCIYMVSEICQSVTTIKEMLHALLLVLPKGFSAPEVTHARISFDGNVFGEEDVASIPQYIRKDIYCGTQKRGAVEIFLRDNSLTKDESTFLTQEAFFLENITQRIGEGIVRRESEERNIHLNTVLKAIRNVNQLIVKEKDRDRLIDDVCKNLVETRGYRGAWIALMDAGKVTSFSSAGLGEGAQELHQQLLQNKFPSCATRALQMAGVRDISSSVGTCNDCPLKEIDQIRSGIAVQLTSGSRCFGIMCVSFYTTFTIDKEEFDLIREVSDDIALAIQAIELESQRRQAEENLIQSEEKHRSMIEHLPIGFFTVTLDGVFLEHNTEFAKFLGFPPEENLVGKKSPDFWQNPEHRQAYLAEISTKGMARNYFIPAKKITGEKIYVEINSRLLKDFAGHPYLIECTVLDITDRKNAEEALKRTMHDLARSNAELERFAYVASHDLQEPLRMVTSYLQLIERRYPDKLDDDGREFIAYAVDGATRMKTLIGDLLAYSRVGTRGKDFTRVDCQATLNKAVANLKIAIEENNATINTDTLPFVVGDNVQLEQVFQNLLGNAIKFHSDKKPIINIGVEEKNDEWQFSVQDNGIGIDPQYFDRIFIIFQRLHSRQDYPGTGIGLAVTKRIIERHGGRIWIESQPNEGATFYFTIPIRGVDNHENRSNTQ